MVVLGWNRKSEVSLYPVRHNKTVLAWKTSRPDHTVDEVLVAYTAKVVVSSRVQKSAQLSDNI